MNPIVLSSEIEFPREPNGQLTPVTFGGDAALEWIKECHNEIILNKMAANSG